MSLNGLHLWGKDILLVPVRTVDVEGETVVIYCNSRNDALTLQRQLHGSHMTQAQRDALAALSSRYDVPFSPMDFQPTFDLPVGYVAGWIGGDKVCKLYVGCDPEGNISS